MADDTDLPTGVGLLLAALLAALLAVLTMHVVTVPTAHGHVSHAREVAGSQPNRAPATSVGGMCSNCVLADDDPNPLEWVLLGLIPMTAWQGSPQMIESPDPPVPRKA